MKISIDITPSDPIAKAILEGGLSNSAVRNGVMKAINRTVADGIRLIVKATPVHFGRLRDSITNGAGWATEDNLLGIISTNVEYAPFVEFGTGVYNEMPGAPKVPIIITAKQASNIASYHVQYRLGKTSAQAAHLAQHSLKFTIGGKTLYRKSVKIYGMTARAPFRESMPDIEKLYIKYLKQYVWEPIMKDGGE